MLRMDTFIGILSAGLDRLLLNHGLMAAAAEAVTTDTEYGNVRWVPRFKPVYEQHVFFNPSNAEATLAQERKNLWKPTKPCHVGIHWIALTEYSQMSIHSPRFRGFFRISALFCIGKISQQQHKG